MTYLNRDKKTLKDVKLSFTGKINLTEMSLKNRFELFVWALAAMTNCIKSTATVS